MEIVLVVAFVIVALQLQLILHTLRVIVDGIRALRSDLDRST